MRIALVVHDYNRTAGHSRYVVELAERYAVAHDVHVYSNTFTTPAPAGVHAHHVPAVRLTALTTILSFAAPAALAVGRGDYDVVHAQGFVLPRADVVTMHICNGRWLTGRQEQEGHALGWRDRLFASVVVPLERRMCRVPGTTIIAISQALRADLQRVYGVRNDIAVVHHGVDPRQFNPRVRERHRDGVRRELGIGAEEIVFLYVGDLRKGAAPAVAALAAVPGRLVLVSRSNPAAMHALARSVGVRDRITTIPPTTEVERYYGAADAFVLPTPYDAFGMVVTEAMACGLPVVTTTAAGASEVIADGRTGLVIDAPVDVAALAAAMRRLSADGELRARLGAGAAEAMGRHSWDAVARDTMAVYQRVAAAGARS